MTDPSLISEPSSVVTACAAAAYLLLLVAGTVIAVMMVFRSMHRIIDWNGCIAQLRARPWGWRELLIVLALTGLASLIPLALFAVHRKSGESSMLVLESLLMDGGGLAVIALLVFTRRWSWREAFGDRPPLPKLLTTASCYYLALMPLLIFASLIYQGVLMKNGYPPSLQEIALFLSGSHPLWVRIYLMLLAVFLAPAFEESLFRGIVLPVLVRHLGAGAGIFLTSLIFAAIHLHLPSFAPLVIVATGFSLAYLYTGSLWVPILMHSLFNGVNLTLLLALRN